jgi:hypothetical protein
MTFDPGQIMGLFVAAFLSGTFLVWLVNSVRDWWRRPLLRIVADRAVDSGCLVLNVTGGGQRALHARVRVRNDGGGTAKGAIGFLVRIAVDGPNGREEFLGDVVSAEWAHRGHRALDIPSRFEGFYLDIYAQTADATDAVTTAGVCGADKGFVLVNAASRMTRMYLDVVIAGDNFRPVRTSLMLSRDGTFEGLRMARNDGRVPTHPVS